MAPLLQLAMDTGEPDDLLELVSGLGSTIDIVEVGTPLLLRHGLGLVRRIRDASAGPAVLADAKIVDGAAEEAAMAFDAGADYVTVLGLADDRSVAEAVAAAGRAGGRVVADLICVSDVVGRSRRLAELGVDLVAVHTGVDQQEAGETPLAVLRRLRGDDPGLPVAVAGGIGPDNVAQYLPWRPDVVVSGSGILRAADPLAAARALREAVSA